MTQYKTFIDYFVSLFAIYWTIFISAHAFQSPPSFEKPAFSVIIPKVLFNTKHTIVPITVGVKAQFSNLTMQQIMEMRESTVSAMTTEMPEFHILATASYQESITKPKPHNINPWGNISQSLHWNNVFKSWKLQAGTFVPAFFTSHQKFIWGQVLGNSKRAPAAMATIT